MRFNSAQEALAHNLKPIEMALDDWTPEAREAAAEARRKGSGNSVEKKQESSKLSPEATRRVESTIWDLESELKRMEDKEKSQGPNAGRQQIIKEHKANIQKYIKMLR